MQVTIQDDNTYTAPKYTAPKKKDTTYSTTPSSGYSTKAYQQPQKTYEAAKTVQEPAALTISDFIGEWRGRNDKNQSVSLSLRKSDEHVFDVVAKVGTEVVTGHCYNNAENLLMLKLNTTEGSNMDASWLYGQAGDSLVIRHVGTQILGGTQRFVVKKK
jgi:hypothetical protein